MAISLADITQGGPKRAPIMVIHGTPGIGKTTFAACSESPIFIRAEDGLGEIEVPTFPEIESLDQFMEAIGSLFEEEHDFKTVVIDSLSALEPMIWAKVAQDHGKKNLEDIGYGKGYIYALDYWRDMMDACKALSRKGIMPILIAHTDIARFDSPETDPYDRYQIKLHKKAFQFLYEQADIIGFANEPVIVRKQDKDDKKGRGVSRGSRQLNLIESAAVIAKNRYSMPESVPLVWEEFAQHLPDFR